MQRKSEQNMIELVVGFYYHYFLADRKYNQICVIYEGVMKIVLASLLFKDDETC